MSAIEGISCDSCGKTSMWDRIGVANAAACRKILASRGWHVVKKKGQKIRDICPTCWDRGDR